MKFIEKNPNHLNESVSEMIRIRCLDIRCLGNVMEYQ